MRVCAKRARVTVNVWKATRTQHGRRTGFALHLMLGEAPCEPCRRVRAKYRKIEAKIEAEEKAVEDREEA